MGGAFIVKQQPLLMKISSSHGPIHYLTAVHNGNGGPFELWVRSGLILVCTSLLSELTQALCAPRVGSENWRITSIGP